MSPGGDGSTSPWFCTKLWQTGTRTPRFQPRCHSSTSQALLPTAGSWQHVLHSELVCSHGDAVDELHCAPEAMEFHTLIHVHHPVAGQGPAPDGIIQEGADPRQNNLKHGQATAEAFFGQQVPFPCNCNLLKWTKTKCQILVKAPSWQNLI